MTGYTDRERRPIKGNFGHGNPYLIILINAASARKTIPGISSDSTQSAEACIASDRTGLVKIKVSGNTGASYAEGKNGFKRERTDATFCQFTSSSPSGYKSSSNSTDISFISIQDLFELLSLIHCPTVIS